MAKKKTTTSKEGPPTLERIDLEWLELQDATVRIKGTTPLVAHAFSHKALTEMEEKQTGKATKQRREIRKPEEDFYGAIHWMNGTGHGEPSGFPCVAIKEAMASAAIRFMSFKYKVEIYGNLFIPGQLLEIKAAFPTMRRDYVRNSGPSRTVDLRYRPEYFPWEMNIPIRYKSNTISLKQVVGMVAHAGFSVGIGEWRPEKGGDWGRWEVVGIDSKGADGEGDGLMVEEKGLVTA